MANTPKIRFKGFTDDWEQRKLLDCLTQPISDGPHETPDLVDEGVPFISVDAIVDNMIDFERKRGYITEEYDLECRKKYSPQRDDVYLVKSGSTVGKVAIVETDERFNIWSPLAAMRANKEILIPKYLYYFLQLDDIQDEISAKSKGGTQPNLSMRILEKFIIRLPDVDEQKKISDSLSLLDTLITLHQRKCDETKELKKFMLQKMFPKNGEKKPEIRFNGFTDDWEQRKLGGLVEIKDSARIPNAEWSDSGVPYIRASDITNEDASGVLFISQKRYEFYKSKTGAPAKGDVLFNGGGEIGKTMLNSSDSPIYVQGGAVLYARTSVSDCLEGQYLKTYFETPNAQRYFEIASAGGTMKHFTLKPSQEMPIILPQMEEQKKIGEYFSDLDNLITLHQRKCDNLKEVKKYMLQNMFPQKG